MSPSHWRPSESTEGGSEDDAPNAQELFLLEMGERRSNDVHDKPGGSIAKSKGKEEARAFDTVEEEAKIGAHSTIRVLGQRRAASEAEDGCS